MDGARTGMIGHILDSHRPSHGLRYAHKECCAGGGTTTNEGEWVVTPDLYGTLEETAALLCRHQMPVLDQRRRISNASYVSLTKQEKPDHMIRERIVGRG
jgi:hypothetical protein